MLGLPRSERDQIEGIVSAVSAYRNRTFAEVASTATAEQAHRARASIAEKQLNSQLMCRALIDLATNPPLKVGHVQRLTTTRTLRPFPLGLRTSRKNMSPIPGWLAGGQVRAAACSRVRTRRLCLRES